MLERTGGEVEVPQVWERSRVASSVGGKFAREPLAYNGREEVYAHSLAPIPFGYEGRCRSSGSVNRSTNLAKP